MIHSNLVNASSQPVTSSVQNNTSNSTTNQNITKASASQSEGGITNKTLNSPVPSPFEESASPPALSEEKKEQLEEAVEQTYNKPEIRTTNKTIEGPTEGTQAGGPPNATATSTNSVPVPADGSVLNSLPASSKDNLLQRISNVGSNQPQITVYSNETITVPSTSISSILEPSVANNGEIVFATGNWIAARSTDGGSTWRYLSPFADFRTFCCDQLVVFDPNRQIFAWYRQGIANDNGENLVKISVSDDASNWWTYNIRPTDFDPTWTNQWFDYAHFAIGDQYLYFTTNVFSLDGEFIRSVIARISLDDLRDAVPPALDVYFDTSGDVFTFTPVQGAKNVMYWGSHVSNSEMRIYAWPENQPWTEITRADVEVPAWTPASMIGMRCPSPDGNDMCGRADSRITAGWISGDSIGFFWNADRGGQSVHGATFPWPYINAATFNVNNMTYQGRPYIWSTDFAFLYGSASANIRGDVGIELVYGGGNRYPSLAAGIADSVSGNPPPWDLTTLMVGTNGPSRGEWGDYITTRTSNGSSDTWISVGFTLQGCNMDNCIEPRYFVFGRQDNNNTSASVTTSATDVTIDKSTITGKKVLFTTDNAIEEGKKNHIIQQ